MIHYVNNNKILGLELVFTTGAGWRGEHNLVGLKLARLGSNTLYLVMRNCHMPYIDMIWL